LPMLTLVIKVLLNGGISEIELEISVITLKL
jgi:hypothetical protein